jgi:Protein kinase domain
VHRDSFESDRPFEREFEGIRRYEPLSRSNPGLLPVLHVGRSEDGLRFYYVMELADPLDPGGVDVVAYEAATLRAWVARRGALMPEQCVDVAGQLGAGLLALHEAGLVHRDVKPSNVLFLGGKARLGDPGLVATSGEARSFVGTEGYVPPEGPGTVSADLFALGRVLYEALTGRPPERFPEVPSEWVRAVDAEARFELMELILKLADPRGEQRYPAAADFLADLALLRSGRSVRRLRRMEQGARWLKRLVPLTLGAVVTVAGWAVWLQRQADWEREQTRRVEAAERSRRRELVNVYAVQAMALRLSGRFDRRMEALEAIRSAAALSPDSAQLLELRSQAAAAVALPEQRFLPALEWLARRDAMGVTADTSGRRVAVVEADSSVSIRTLPEGTVETQLPALSRYPDEVVGYAPGDRWICIRIGRENWLGELDSGTWVGPRPPGCFLGADGAWVGLTARGVEGWKAPGDPVAREWLGAGGELEVAAADPRGERVAVGGTLGVWWWESDGGLASGRLDPGVRPTALAWSRSGRELAVGTERGDLLLYRLPDPTVVWQVRAHGGAIRRVTFHPEEAMLGSVAEDDSVVWVETVGGRVRGRMNAIGWGIGWDAAGRLGLVARGDTLGWVEQREPEAVTRVRMGASNTSDGGVGFVPDGGVVAGGPWGLRAWSEEAPEVWEELGGVAPFGVQFVPGPGWLMAWDGARVTARKRAPGWAAWDVPEVRFPRGVESLSMSTDGQVAAWSHLAEGEVWFRRRGEDQLWARVDSPKYVSVSGDGNWLAVGSYAGQSLRVWHTSTNQPREVFRGSRELRPLLDPTGHWLAGVGPRVRLWELPNDGGELRPVPLPEDSPNAGYGSQTVAFSADGRRFACVLGDRRVHVINLPEGTPVLRLEGGDSGRVLGVALSADGSRVAWTTTEGDLEVWRLPELELALSGLGLREGTPPANVRRTRD